jgi:hypothetical protein
MTTYYGPKSPAFRGGPNHVIAYDVILAPTVVHGPDVRIRLVSDELPIINHFTLHEGVCAIAPPLIIPDDVTTSEGRLIHYNRIRMIAASILYHHALDGSFPQLAREKVRHDMNMVLSYTPEMVIFIATPHEFINRPLQYPPILQAHWMGSFPGQPYVNVVLYPESVIGRRITEDCQVIFGPQTFLEYLVDNYDEYFTTTLERVDNHYEEYERLGHTAMFDWLDRAYDCLKKHREILRKDECVRYAPDVGDDAPMFDWGVDYKVVPFDT